jgi:hypothetical protein
VNSKTFEVIVMTQVVYASANIAAYAMEAVKPIARASRKTDVEIAIKELNHLVHHNEDLDRSEPVAVVKASALSVYLPSSARNQNPQTTLAQAEEAYKEIDETED